MLAPAHGNGGRAPRGERSRSRSRDDASSPAQRLEAPGGRDLRPAIARLRQEADKAEEAVRVLSQERQALHCQARIKACELEQQRKMLKCLNAEILRHQKLLARKTGLPVVSPPRPGEMPLEVDHSEGPEAALRLRREAVPPLAPLAVPVAGPEDLPPRAELSDDALPDQPGHHEDAAAGAGPALPEQVGPRLDAAAAAAGPAPPEQVGPREEAAVPPGPAHAAAGAEQEENAEEQAEEEG